MNAMKSGMGTIVLQVLQSTTIGIKKSLQKMGVDVFT